MRIASARDGVRSPLSIWLAYGMLILAARDSAVGVAGLDMPVTLQIATIRSRCDYCNLREEIRWGMLHDANMDKSKNGGPNYLQEWREYRDMTQEQLAQEVGTTASVVSLLESGERGLSAKWLRRLAPALRVRVGWLLEQRPDEVGSDVLAAWEKVPDEEKPRALRVLHSFSTAVSE